MNRTLLASAAAAGAMAILAAGAAQAGTLYAQGFETNTSGWQTESGTTTSSISRTPSGGGALGLTAYAGADYAEVHAGLDAYMPGYGSGGYSFMSKPAVGPSPYPGPFTQSLAIYVDVNTPAPTNASVPAFWLDAAPSSSSAADVANNGLGYGGEQSFQFYYNGSSVGVGFTGDAPSVTLTQSGWYDFQFAYAQGATPASLSTTTLSVLNGATVLASQTFQNGNDGDPLLSGNLGGPGYVWLTTWQDGFSNNVLGVDNLIAAAIPEPATWAMLILGLFGLGAALRSRRQDQPASIAA